MRPAPPPWPSRPRATAGRRLSSRPVAVEMRDVAPGLWLWRQPHPDWREGADWDPIVTSVAVESRGVKLVLDALAPPPSQHDVWERLDRLQPDVAVVLKPDHLRDVDLFVR